MTGVAGAIILAAGQSQRFGSDKRQVIGPWGESMLHHVVRLYQSCFDHVGVVVGANDPFGLATCERFGVTALANEEAHLGMGRSLATGIAWLEGRSLPMAIIGLADMPWINAAIIQAVTRQAMATQRLVAPVYRQELGFPRAIPQSLYGKLRDLRGDRGASTVIDWSQALLLPCDDPAVLRDVDHPSDIHTHDRRQGEK